MVKQKSHNVFSIQGRIVGAPSVRMSRQGDGGYVDVTLNVVEEVWDADTRAFVQSTTRVPLSFYSKDPDAESRRLRSGYAVIVDGHIRGRSYTDSQGGQRLSTDLRVDNIDIIEPFLSNGGSITPEPEARKAASKPSMQAGYKEQAEAQKPATKKPDTDRVAPAPYTGPTQTVDEFDDDEIPF